MIPKCEKSVTINYLKKIRTLGIKNNIIENFRQLPKKEIICKAKIPDRRFYPKIYNSMKKTQNVPATHVDRHCVVTITRVVGGIDAEYARLREVYAVSTAIVEQRITREALDGNHTIVLADNTGQYMLQVAFGRQRGGIEDLLLIMINVENGQSACDGFLISRVYSCGGLDCDELVDNRQSKVCDSHVVIERYIVIIVAQTRCKTPCCCH